MNLAVSDTLLVFFAFAWLGVASYTDLRKREVPDWLSFSLISVAFAVRAIAAILAAKPNYFFHALIAFGIFFLISTALYYAKIFGGGDSKLLLGLAPLLATKPYFVRSSSPFLFDFFVNSLFFGAVYAASFGFVVAIKSKSFNEHFSLLSKKTRKLKIICWLTACLFLVLAYKFLPLVFFSIIFFLFPLFWCFAKTIEAVLIKKVEPNQLAEGDLLAKPVKIKHALIKPSVHGLSKQEIMALKAANKKVEIKIGLPFVPVFLIALICSLLWGNLLLKLITLFKEAFL